MLFKIKDSPSLIILVVQLNSCFLGGTGILNSLAGKGLEIVEGFGDISFIGE